MNGKIILNLKNNFFSCQKKEKLETKRKNVNSKTRNGVETSCRKMHTVTTKGFELKVIMFVFAYSFKFLVAT